MLLIAVDVVVVAVDAVVDNSNLFVVDNSNLFVVDNSNLFAVVVAVVVVDCC